MSLFPPKNRFLLRLPLVVALGALGACAGLPQPFSQVDGHRYYRAPIDTYAVQIVSVDGRGTLDSPVFIEPGLRKITVQGPPDGVHRFGEQRTIELNVAPCVRYYLVAQKANRLMSDYTVKVDYEEPIGGCTNKVASK